MASFSKGMQNAQWTALQSGQWVVSIKTPRNRRLAHTQALKRDIGCRANASGGSKGLKPRVRIAFLFQALPDLCHSHLLAIIDQHLSVSLLVISSLHPISVTLSSVQICGLMGIHGKKGCFKSRSSWFFHLCPISSLSLSPDAERPFQHC